MQEQVIELDERKVSNEETRETEEDRVGGYRRALGKESLSRALKTLPTAANVGNDRRRMQGELTYGWKGIRLL